MKDIAENFRMRRPGIHPDELQALVEKSRPNANTHRVIVNRMPGELSRAMKALGKRR